MGLYIEAPFTIFYLIFAITSGIIILKKSKTEEQTLIGLSILLLGLGDSTHLIPRIISLVFDDFPRFAVSLGIGKLITSITMTVFYLLLYMYIEKKYKYSNKTIDILFYLLVIIRVTLCLLPANNWTLMDGNYLMGILRNIPFMFIGLIIIILSYKYIRPQNDAYKNLYLYVSLSFIFYMIVVLFASKLPILGMFMLPKTICYMLMIVSGRKTY